MKRRRAGALAGAAMLIIALAGAAGCDPNLCDSHNHASGCSGPAPSQQAPPPPGPGGGGPQGAPCQGNDQNTVPNSSGWICVMGQWVHQ